jgi:hypothetical protein
MGIADIKPGMTGIGRTVFDGTHVEEFKVNIIGVLENVIGTHRNLILAKLVGGPLAHTGVIAGMSGSPVCIDGKLIGAVSYSLGSFPKEPIAGITPIAEMTDSAAVTDIRPAGAKVHLEVPLTRDGLTAAFRKALNWNRPFADRPSDAQFTGVSALGLSGDQLGTLMRPIATPLAMSGFDPDVADLLGSAFRDQGFIPSGAAAGGARIGEMAYSGPLKPGDAVGVMLVGGDLQLGATGTVTHIDGDHVYAFGHPMYNLGPTEFPMTRAYVYTVLPSLFSSMKLSSVGEVIGAVVQDRATAIGGKLGPMIQSSSRLNRRAPSRSSVQRRQRSAARPLMAYASVLNTLNGYERQYWGDDVPDRGSARVKQHGRSVPQSDLGRSGGDERRGLPHRTDHLFARQRVRKVNAEGVDITIGTTEEPKTATLERVWLDDPRPRAGGACRWRCSSHLPRRRRRPHAADRHSGQRDRLALVLVSMAHASASGTARSADRTAAQLDLVIKSLNKARRNNTLYVSCSARTPARSSRRDVVLAAAVGAGRPRSGSQRRHLQPGTTRRSANGSCRPSTPFPARANHHHRLTELSASSFSLRSLFSGRPWRC